MAFEDMEAELGLLLTRMLNEPEDRHQIYFQIRKTLSDLKASGMPLPEDLVQLEHDLETEFTADMEDQARLERLHAAISRRVPPRNAP